MFKALALPQVTRLHLLAHGAPGEIRFGGQAVTAADFRQRFDGAAQRDLSIAFWSCRTGAGAAGQAFVQAVSAATGARVAATSELVGAADKGGNWDLGVTAPFSAEARAGFGEVLIVSAPTLVTVACNPPDDGVLSTNQIVLVFSEPVVVNTVFQIVIFSLTNPVRVFQSDGPTSMFGIPSGSGIITGNTLTLTLGQSLAPGESYYVNTLNPGPQGTGLMSVSTSQLFQDIVGPTTYNFTVGVPTFTALESGGTLSFGGDATGDIALTVAADGALTAVRGGVTATEHPNIKDITSVTTGGATITLTGAAALGETNFPQGTDLAIANAGQVFRTVDIGGTKYYFPATVAELGSAGVFVLKNATDAYSTGTTLKPGFAFYEAAGIAAITNHQVLTNDIDTLPAALKVYGVTLGIDPTKADTLDLDGITKAVFETQIDSVDVAIGTDAYKDVFINKSFLNVKLTLTDNKVIELIDLIALDTVVAAPSTTLQAYINTQLGSGITLDGTYKLLSADGKTTLLAMMNSNLQFDPTGLADVTPDLTDASDTGVLNNDDLTNDTTPTVSINMTGKTGLVAGNIIQVIDTSASDAVVGSYTILAGDLTSGAWSATSPKDITLSTLNSGTYILKTQIAESTTNPTNVGAASAAALTVTVDTDRPTSEVTAHDETATGGTIDYTFSEAVQLQSESTNAITPVSTNGAELAIYAVDSKGDYSLATKASATISAASFASNLLTITYTGTLPDVATSTSPDGPSYVVDAWGYDIVDLAGNQIVPDVDQIFTIADTTAPAAPTIEVLYVSETGVSPVDGISSDATPIVRVRLNGTDNTAPIAGDKVTLLSDSVSVGTSTISAANITVGSVDITATTLGADGIKSLTATITDQATTPNTSAASTAISYTLDTTAPTSRVTAHDEVAKTITYTFSEAVQLQDESKSATFLDVTKDNNAEKLAIYAVTGTDYSEATKTGTVTGASFAGNALTITYTGTLDEGVKYVVDAWGYDIVDLAGNEIVPAAAQMFTVPLSRHIDSADYIPTTRELTLSGTNFDTLLETGETAVTDIKGRLDWSKLSWDINGDNGTTANVGFALADIASAKVTNGTTLTIVLTTTKATALAATSGYGGTAEGTIDTLDVTAGFTKTLAGVAATTDAKADAALKIAADTTAPDTTIDSAAYVQDARALTLTGTNFDTLLEKDETATTDIKARLDWSKLSWDINGDDGTTANVSFTLADIASVKVIDATHLSIVLTSAKATALAATTGYGATGNAADTLDVTAGFTKDLAGNASTTDAKADALLTIATDNTAPTTTINTGTYDAGANSLILTGSNFSTLLESSESAATDIKGRLDWTKLSWDINGDDGTTTNVSFTLADIASAKVVNNSIMIIALTDAKAAALIATSGYGATGNVDTLDVTVGFTKDLAGNASTTDAKANAELTIDAVLDLNGSGNGLNQGAILSGAALPFTTGGFNLLGGNAPGFNNVMITFANADIRDAEKETIDVGGSTIALNASAVAANLTNTIDSVTYSVIVAKGADTSVVFTKSGGDPVTTAQAEALLDALNYHNTAGTQTGGDRTFTVKATASSGTSPKATFTISGDGDGIPEAEEDAVAPLVDGIAGDGNGDGTVDSEQNNVTSAAVTDNDGNASYVTIATGNGISQENVTITPAPDVSELPAELQGSEFLTQVVSFDLPNVAENSTQRISLYVDASLNVNDYLKQDKDGIWVSVKNTAGTNFSITPTPDGTKKIIAFDLTDQGVLDQNRTAGQISDPGAPVFLNTLPVITSNGGGAEAAVSIAENTTAVTTVVSTDDVGDTQTYSITGGTDSAKFGINTASGVLTFVSAPDFEAPTDNGSNNSYVAVVTATDTNSGTDTQTITVNVTDVSEGGGGGGYTPPTNYAPTGAVTISGTPTQGQTLTAANTLADANGLGAISYQWLADGVAITDAKAVSYTLTAADVGKIITVAASYIDGASYAERVSSGATTAIAAVTSPSPTNHAPTGAITITGSAVQGQTLAVTNALADADGLGGVTYVWMANGTPTLTANTYKLTQADVGKTITVAANYIDSLGNSERVFSAATAAVANVNDLPTGAVTIRGNATQDQTLAVTNTLADIDGLGTIGYQWLADGVAISGAITDTFILTPAQTGKTITVAASYTDKLGTAEQVLSLATPIVAPSTNHIPTGAVTINGNATQGQMLTATNTLADADGLGTIGYQWFADGMAITGAVGNTLKLAQAEVGKTITVAASYTDKLGATEKVVSTATTAVTNVNDLPTGAVTISGTATQGQTLTAANTLADIDGLGTISYQWLANGTAITGAKTASYTLTATDVGKTITVAASYTDQLGTAEKVVSRATSAVVNVTTVADKGTPGDDSNLKGTAGNDDIDGLAGNDSLTGLAGNDTLNGGVGNDKLNGGVGSDSMIGGDGSDTYYIDNVGDKVIETASSSGIDLIYSSLATYALAVNVEKGTILGTAAATLIGNTLNNVLTGNNGADSLLGNAGNDSLTGLAGNDTLNGGVGNDKLNGGVGSDSMIGGDGSDTYYIDNVGDKVIETASSSGIDLVYSKLSTYTLAVNVEKGTILGTTAATLIGNTLNNVLTGNNGADSLLGNAGNDSLTGLAGNDTLNGGVGNDKLTGGTGNDIFQFNTALAAANVDKITDFKPIDDSIVLENAIFTKLTAPGKLAAANFYASTTGTAHDSNDFILYNTKLGALLYDTDGSGASAPIQFAIIGVGLALTAADFVVS